MSCLKNVIYTKNGGSKLVFDIFMLYLKKNASICYVLCFRRIYFDLSNTGINDDHFDRCIALY